MAGDEASAAAPIGVIRLDGQNRVTSANAHFLSWYGAEPIAVLGRPLDELLLPAPGDLVPSFELGPRMLLHASDQERAVLADRTPTDDGAILTVMDATARFRALGRLREQYALADRTRSRLELVIDASLEFAAASTEDRLADVLASTVAQAYRAEDAVVLLSEGTGELRVAAGSNVLDAWVDAVDAARLSWGMRRVVLVAGADEARALSPVLADAMLAEGVHSLLVAPLRHEQTGFGLVACFFRHPRVFDQEAAPLADAITGQAAQTLATLRLQHRLAHAAMHDETTGLPNRRLLEEQSAATLRTRTRAVYFIDLDGFKGVNDRLGHRAGDEVLRVVADRLRAAVREGDVVARYGGDEFVAVCELEQPESAGDIAERLLGVVAEPFELAEEVVALGASIGMTVSHPFDPRSLDRLIRDADQAMYLAKNAGGNRAQLSA